MDVEAFARRLPKAELHLHIEGTLEPELMLRLARRNKLKLRFPDVEAVRRAYRFQGLQSFLDIYYEGAAVLRTQRDFHDLAWAYFGRAAKDGVRHAELFFDPQTHTQRGVALGEVVEGLEAAMTRARRELGVTSKLILCFLRHLSEEAAQATFSQARPYLDRIAAVGLDSSEKGHPPRKFERVFARARSEGLLAVAHAGEEGPPGYVEEALDLLKVRRVDHGVRCAEKPALVERLAREGVPLTVCPLSNVKLKVFPDLARHNLKALLSRGVRVTLNSDDPAYFGGYVLDNYVAAARALALSPLHLWTLARNSIEASFLSGQEKRALVGDIMKVGAAYEDADPPRRPRRAARSRRS